MGMGQAAVQAPETRSIEDLNFRGADAVMPPFAESVIDVNSAYRRKLASKGVALRLIQQLQYAQNTLKAPVAADEQVYVGQRAFAGAMEHLIFTADLRQKKTRAPIAIESKNGLSNLRGALAMARTMDPNSGTAQFFINTVDNPRLDYAGDANPGYAVFGKVVSGMDVVDKIRAVETGAQGPFASDVPKTPVVIEKASVVE